MDLHPTIACCLAFFEAFRRLGYKPEEIFFAHDDAGIGMLLRVAGHEDFPLLAGPLDAAVVAQWGEATRLWNDSVNGLSYVERNIIWQTHMPTMRFIGLTTRLLQEGYTPPGLALEAIAEFKRRVADATTEAANVGLPLKVEKLP